MAEEKDVIPKKKFSLSLGLLVVLVNSLVALAAMGFLVYTKLLYKRPVITEHGERQRLAQSKASPVPETTAGTIVFDPMTVNIESTPAHPKSAEGTPQQIEGKLHYATVGFVLEVRDMSQKEAVEAVRTLILDKFLSLIGRKDFRELTTVQGRYLLKTQLLDSTNQIINERREHARRSKDALVTNIFFTQFIVQ